ncbi:MAG TPA: carboxylesterase/lipase family protein [Rhizomicrobium sp.]|jgi:para-nitrobenzyl esterase|nr:carboxylesterase/lipase family protein [Rhizomicrobium sp.]
MVTVDAPCGRLSGLALEGMLGFRGIPYAKPPPRWSMPEALAPWPGTRDATRFGPACPQAASRLDRMSGGGIGAQSEDCLFLNIWTPTCDGNKRPVMVWIHGGSFTMGGGHQGLYDGRALAARDCVIVTINYRLGAFGFLALDGIATGAEGIADQILALQWVQANIAAFGGDPGNVTVFGESAGAMSIAGLLSSPRTKGLFHKAILQSGAAHIGHAPERAARVTQALLAELGVDAVRLRDVPADALLKAQTAIIVKGNALKLGGLPFQPALDNPILPIKPIDAIRAGSAAGIPVLTGTTKEEWKLFTALDPRLRFMTQADLATRLARLDADAAPALLAAYTEGSPFERFNAVMTDKAFRVPAMRLLEAQAAPVYAYRFDWRSKFLGGLFGSCHALELGFVFGTYGEKPASTFFGKGPTADALSHAMIDAWTGFARTGDPGWPRYDAQTRQTMIFGDGAPHIAAAPNETQRAIWNAIPERKLGP